MHTTESSETFIHRVKVLNLPKHELASIKQFFKLHNLHKFKKAPMWEYAYLNFETAEEAKVALEKLNGKEFKKRLLSTEYAKVSEKQFRDRFKANKTIEQEDTRTPAQRLADQVTPLHKLSYEEQVAKKRKAGVRHLRDLRKKLNALPDLSEEARAQISWTISDNLDDACQILDPIQSPITHGYRTKCEFTIGKNIQGERKVGFLLGQYRDGVTAVLEPYDCLHVSDKAKEIVRAMERYVRNSEYDVYDKVAKTGVWRSIMTKTQETGDSMEKEITDELSDDQLEQEKEKIRAYWTQLKPEINTTTLMLQTWNGVSNGITDKGQTEILMGDGYVYEHLLGCSSAFFQVNTPATELLYSKCAEWCNISQDKKTTLLDLCCGTGTIGITMAKTVDRVIGIEMIPEAIVDARANAHMNNITNVQYYASKVEDKIDIVTNERNEQVVAVLDPPRAGVHPSVIRAVRESPQIKKVIYISCDAKQAMQNFIGPTSNRAKGIPFRPVRAVSIDLFPHTEHCELMIEFIRIN
ncbi:hypothetical protein RMCBS344292_10191 [Rhizopus microsporus]|nr:hypothetical protein RMCBS344292_10191 [Rhizopus microsporus]